MDTSVADAAEPSNVVTIHPHDRSVREFIDELRAKQAAVDDATNKGRLRVAALREEQSRNGGF